MNLASLEQQRVIDENPSDVTEFGLAEPRVEVTFKSGGQEQKLFIGSKTPTGGDVYARTAASPKVFLIASYLDSTFNRSTFDLRDKTALEFERVQRDDILGGRVVYCAGCMLTVQAQMPKVADGLKKAFGGKPFFAAFTFGEQGRVAGRQSIHGNLMISSLVFSRGRA